jgi:hypothetical protein
LYFHKLRQSSFEVYLEQPEERRDEGRGGGERRETFGGLKRMNEACIQEINLVMSSLIRKLT